jgi:hypothetical protein
MLKKLFGRAATANLDDLTFIHGGYGWVGPRGYELYELERDRLTGDWNLLRISEATQGDRTEVTVATIPKLAEAALLLRRVIDQDLKPRYGGIVNALHGRMYAESGGQHSLSAVERALELRR